MSNLPILNELRAAGLLREAQPQTYEWARPLDRQQLRETFTRPELGEHVTLGVDRFVRTLLEAYLSELGVDVHQDVQHGARAPEELPCLAQITLPYDLRPAPYSGRTFSADAHMPGHALFQATKAAGLLEPVAAPVLS